MIEIYGIFISIGNCFFIQTFSLGNIKIIGNVAQSKTFCGDFRHVTGELVIDKLNGKLSIKNPIPYTSMLTELGFFNTLVFTDGFTSFIHNSGNFYIHVTEYDDGEFSFVLYNDNNDVFTSNDLCEFVSYINKKFN